jgi:hypothetical protein
MNRIWILPICVFLLLAYSTDAQKVDKGTSETSTWKEFKAEDGSFRILFPQPPQTNSALDLPVPKYYISTVSPVEKYSLEFKDNPAPLMDELERQARLEDYVPLPALPKNLPMPTIPSARTAPISDPWKRQEAFKIISRQNLQGFEFTVEREKDRTTDTFRAVIVKQREFKLKVTTPLLSALPAAEQQSYKRKIDVFFESFLVREIPPAKYQPIRYLPDDLGSALQRNTYSNKYFNFKIDLPAGWKIGVLDQGSGANSMQIGVLENGAKILDGADKMSASDRWRRRNNPDLVSASKGSKSPDGGDSTEILIEALRPNSPEQSLKEFVEQKKSIAQDDSGGTAVLPDHAVNINGHEFLMFEVEHSDEERGGSPAEQPRLRERMYFKSVNGIFLIFSLKYRDVTDEKILADSIKSLIFYGGKKP